MTDEATMTDDRPMRRRGDNKDRQLIDEEMIKTDGEPMRWQRPTTDR
jgi:hypothetical protein